VESFHASLRAEFLDRELFYTMKEVTVMMEDWRNHYNYERPHGSLANRPPVIKTKIANSPQTKKTIPQNSH
jgi:putative transposase